MEDIMAHNIIMSNKGNGTAKDMRKLNDFFVFEVKALEVFFGNYWRDRFKRHSIFLSWNKFHPTKQIMLLATNPKLTDVDRMSHTIRLLNSYEPILNLPFKSIDGRKEQEGVWQDEHKQGKIDDEMLNDFITRQNAINTGDITKF